MFYCFSLLFLDIFLIGKPSISAVIFIYLKIFISEAVREFFGVDIKTRLWETLFCLIVKALFLYFDSKFMCLLRINCYLETRFSSLGVCEGMVLQEKSCFNIFGRKIDQKLWRDSKSCWSNKVEEISLKDMGNQETSSCDNQKRESFIV